MNCENYLLPKYGKGKKITLKGSNLTNTISGWSRSISTAVIHVDSRYAWYEAIEMALNLYGLAPENL